MSDTISLAQEQAALSYLQALNKWDFDAILTACSDSPDFNYRVRPATLHGFGKPDGFKKDEVVPALQGLKAGLVKELNIGEPWKTVKAADEVVLWFGANGEALNGEPWTNEYVLMITFEPGTNKFLKIVEFVDSLFIQDIQSKLAESKGN